MSILFVYHLQSIMNVFKWNCVRFVNTVNNANYYAPRKALPGFEPGISCLLDRRFNR